MITSLLFVSCMLPVWLFQYFPSLDGSEHLHSTYVVKNSYNPENQTIRKNCRLNIRPFPNWGSQAPLLAEKMVFTLIIGLFIISVLYLSQSVNCGHNISAWASFVFCHSYLLYMGFYGFLMRVPFCFLVLGYGWRHRSQLSLNRIIILYLLFAIIYFCHIFSFALLILCWIFISTILYQTTEVCCPIRFDRDFCLPSDVCLFANKYQRTTSWELELVLQMDIFFSD